MRGARLLTLAAALLVLGLTANLSRVETPLYAQASSFRIVSLNAVSTGTGAAANVAGRTAIVVYLRSVGTTSGGVVTIEEADYDPNTEAVYAGTWLALTTVNASTFTGGAQAAYHVPAGAYRFVRARVSSAITGGGTVSAFIAGH